MSSRPNGDFRLLVSVGCNSDRDRDGDFNTCWKGDTASLLVGASSASEVTQTVNVDYTLDGPGTTLDRNGTAQFVLEPGAAADVLEQMRIQHKQTPLGEYTITATAATGTESVTTSASLTVH